PSAAARLKPATAPFCSAVSPTQPAVTQSVISTRVALPTHQWSIAPPQNQPSTWLRLLSLRLFVRGLAGRANRYNFPQNVEPKWRPEREGEGGKQPSDDRRTK